MRSSFGGSVLITASPTITYCDSARNAFSSVLTLLDRVSLRRSRHKPLARSAEKRQVSDKWIRLSARSITLRGPLGCVGSLKRHIGTCPISPRATEMLPPSRLRGLLKHKPKTLCGRYIGSVWNFMAGPLFAAQRSCCVGRISAPARSSLNSKYAVATAVGSALLGAMALVDPC